jgi:hypothetical protein|tara:strand:- start:356 stop:529 length:174 start_codon:yes stop_codon:yes gene_type:complete
MDEFHEHLDTEFVMRWMALVMDDSFGNGMSDQQVAQAFRQMVTHLESHIDTLEADKR